MRLGILPFVMTAFYFQERIREELARRCAKNARYSLRALARALGFEATVISQILAGKRVPSARSAERLMNGLELEPAERQLFLDSLLEAQKARGYAQYSSQVSSLEARTRPTPELGLELFRVVADLHHYAILALTQTEGFRERRADTKAIAAALDISETEAKLAVERLLKLELLRVNPRGVLEPSQGGFTTADKTTTNAALRKHQRQSLEKALHSLENDPIEARSMTSMTMAIDPARLPEAKRLIEDFTQKLSQFLENGQSTSVYQLGIALFPLQKKG